MEQKKRIEDLLRQDILALALFGVGLLSVAAIGTYVFRVIEDGQRMAVAVAFVAVMAFSLAALFSVYRYVSANRAEVYQDELTAEGVREVVNL